MNPNPVISLIAATLGGVAFHYLAPQSLQNAPGLLVIGSLIIMTMAAVLWHRLKSTRIWFFFLGLVGFGSSFIAAHKPPDPSDPALCVGLIILVIGLYLDERTKQRTSRWDTEPEWPA